MGDTTKIAWTDATFNPWWGCTKVSPGCDNCYAESLDNRMGGEHWGKGAPRRVMKNHYWEQPLKWNRKAQRENTRIKVFCGSMCDVMDDEAPEGQRERLWELIDSTPYLIWQLLTKRPQRYFRYLPSKFVHSNVWLGTTAEDQERYNVRWPILRLAARDHNAPAWISYEPAIGELSMELWAGDITRPADGAQDFPNWIIFGGESGPGRRPMQQWWAEQCAEEAKRAGVNFFMKQMSARTPTEAKGLIPAHLLIHQFPGE